MDILDKAIDYIEENSVLYAKIQSIPLSSEREAISILLDKSGPVETYMDHSAIKKIALRILAKSEESKKAYYGVSNITALLEKTSPGSLCLGEGVFFIRAEAETNPFFQSMNTGQTYVYEAKVNLFIKTDLGN